MDERNNPTDNQKTEMTDILNLMTKEQHMYIFKNFLEKQEKQIYTITNDAVIFDLNDLENDLNVFWRVYDYCVYYINDISRKETIKDYEKQHNDAINNLNNKINNDYEQLKLNAINNITNNKYYN